MCVSVFCILKSTIKIFPGFIFLVLQCQFCSCSPWLLCCLFCNWTFQTKNIVSKWVNLIRRHTYFAWLTFLRGLKLNCLYEVNYSFDFEVNVWFFNYTSQRTEQIMFCGPQNACLRPLHYTMSSNTLLLLPYGVTSFNMSQKAPFSLSKSCLQRKQWKWIFDGLKVVLLSPLYEKKWKSS